MTKPDASLIKRARESSSTLKKIEQLREAEGKEAFGPYSAYRSVGAILFLEKERQQSAFSNFQPRLQGQGLHDHRRRLLNPQTHR